VSVHWVPSTGTLRGLRRPRGIRTVTAPRALLAARSGWRCSPPRSWFRRIPRPIRRPPGRAWRHTLSALARRYGVSVGALVAPITRERSPAPGQRLVIPNATASPTRVTTRDGSPARPPIPGPARRSVRAPVDFCARRAGVRRRPRHPSCGRSDGAVSSSLRPPAQRLAPAASTSAPTTASRSWLRPAGVVWRPASSRANGAVC